MRQGIAGFGYAVAFVGALLVSVAIMAGGIGPEPPSIWPGVYVLAGGCFLILASSLRPKRREQNGPR